MRHSKLLIAASAAMLFTGLACQAADPAPAASAPAAHDMMKGHDMHDMMADHHDGGDGHGGGKSRRCMHKDGMMMGGGRMQHMVPLPALPPGNEKLALQMQAEIMQKVGEILAKYASQVKEAPAAP